MFDPKKNYFYLFLTYSKFIQRLIPKVKKTTCRDSLDEKTAISVTKYQVQRTEKKQEQISSVLH